MKCRHGINLTNMQCNACNVAMEQDPNYSPNGLKYWEVEHNGDHLRIEWNESATFNLQTPIGGQWVDYDCFTCYGIESEQAALEHAMEYLDSSV